MRTFRLLVSGAVLSALLLGPAVLGSTPADVIPGGSADRVSGQLVSAVHALGPEPAPGRPGVTASKWQYEVIWDGDVKLPDRVTFSSFEDLHFMAGDERHAIVCWGYAAFEDKEGWMTGPVRGFVIDGVTETQAMLSGGGAYEGSNMILKGPIGGLGGGPIEGLIFEGYMPQG